MSRRNNPTGPGRPAPGRTFEINLPDFMPGVWPDDGGEPPAEPATPPGSPLNTPVKPPMPDGPIPAPELPIPDGPIPTPDLPVPDGIELWTPDRLNDLLAGDFEGEDASDWPTATPTTPPQFFSDDSIPPIVGVISSLGSPEFRPRRPENAGELPKLDLYDLVDKGVTQESLLRMHHAGYADLRDWIKNNSARYMSWTDLDKGPTIGAPGQLPPDVKIHKSWKVTRPWGVAFTDVGNAVFNGVGSQGREFANGNQNFPEQIVSNGVVEGMRRAPSSPGTGYPEAQLGVNPGEKRPNPKYTSPQGIRVGRSVGGQQLVQWGANGLDEAVNALREAEVVSWTRGNTAGYFVRGVDVNTGTRIARLWVGIEEP